MDDTQKVKILDMIVENARDDAAYYEGKPFIGRNVAAYFGKQGASIAQLARIMKAIVLELDPVSWANIMDQAVDDVVYHQQLDKTVKRNDAEEATPQEREGEPNEEIEDMEAKPLDNRTGTPFSRAGVSRATAEPEIRDRDTE